MKNLEIQGAIGETELTDAEMEDDELDVILAMCIK